MHCNFLLRRKRTTACMRSPDYAGVKIWNNIDNSIKMEPRLSRFKGHLKRYLHTAPPAYAHSLDWRR